MHMWVLQRKKHDDVELYPRALEISQRILGALKHVIVLCGTGYGKSQDMEAAKGLLRTTVNYR